MRATAPYFHWFLKSVVVREFMNISSLKVNADRDGENFTILLCFHRKIFRHASCYRPSVTVAGKNTFKKGIWNCKQCYS